MVSEVNMQRMAVLTAPEGSTLPSPCCVLITILQAGGWLVGEGTGRARGLAGKDVGRLGHRQESWWGF